MSEVLYVDNDNLVEIDGLKDKTDDTYINDATITATLTDADGTTVTGQTFPASFSYVSESNGKYQLTLEDGLSLTAGAKYTLAISISATGDLIGEVERHYIARLRK